MEPDSSDQAALEEAARWYARLQASDCTQQERDAFAAWCRSDVNRAAFRKAERLSALISTAAATHPRLRALADQALAGDHEPSDAVERRSSDAAGRISSDSAERKRAAERRLPNPGEGRRTWWIPASLAAGIVAIGFAVGFAVLHDGAAAMHYASAAAQRELTLADGTSVRLDVRTEIDVDLSDGIRHVHLQRGRALFDVAHDAARPFVVTAGEGKVTALGTVFQVYKRSPRDVVVTLADGAVEVSTQVQGRTERERLAPGEELRMSSEAGVWRKQEVDADAATSWSVGRHVFRDSPLAEAVEEVNRYAARRVVIADPGIAGLTVSGSFVIGDSASIVAAFAAVLPIKVTESGDELLLFRRR